MALLVTLVHERMQPICIFFFNLVLEFEFLHLCDINGMVLVFGLVCVAQVGSTAPLYVTHRD